MAILGIFGNSVFHFSVSEVAACMCLGHYSKKRNVLHIILILRYLITGISSTTLFITP